MSAASSKKPTAVSCQLRKERYKQLLDDGCVIGENAETADVISTLRNVQHILLQSDKIVADGDLKDRVDNTSEVVMDAQVMKMSHELLGSAVQTIDGVEFNDEQFVLAVRAFLTGGSTENTDVGQQPLPAEHQPPQWQRLGQLAAPLCRSFRWSQCMLGTFEADTAMQSATQRQRAQRQSRTPASQQVKPEAVGKLRAQEKPAQVLNEILKQINQIFERNGRVPIPYYGTVVDPHSFMSTVDNCFQVAFLFRDGHLCLDADDEGLPMIAPVRREYQDAKKFAQMRQMVSSIAPSLWRVSVVVRAPPL